VGGGLRKLIFSQSFWIKIFSLSGSVRFSLSLDHLDSPSRARKVSLSLDDKFSNSLWIKYFITLSGVNISNTLWDENL
jgi:hypothetical protein